MRSTDSSQFGLASVRRRSRCRMSSIAGPEPLARGINSDVDASVGGKKRYLKWTIGAGRFVDSRRGAFYVVLGCAEHRRGDLGDSGAADPSDDRGGGTD